MRSPSEDYDFVTLSPSLYVLSLPIFPSVTALHRVSNCGSVVTNLAFRRRLKGADDGKGIASGVRFRLDRIDLSRRLRRDVRDDDPQPMR